VQEIGQMLFRLLRAVIQGKPTEGMSGQLIQPTLQVRQTTQPPV
jgi:DNA-binding LacI/PurR family transcriptional regulator